MAIPYVFIVKLSLHYVLFISMKELVNRNFDVAQQLIFRLFLVIVKASVMQANCRLKKGFLSRFQAMKQELWNHETAQVNLNRQRIVFGDDKDRLLPTYFLSA